MDRGRTEGGEKEETRRSAKRIQCREKRPRQVPRKTGALDATNEIIKTSTPRTSWRDEAISSAGAGKRRTHAGVSVAFKNVASTYSARPASQQFPCEIHFNLSRRRFSPVCVQTALSSLRFRLKRRYLNFIAWLITLGRARSATSTETTNRLNGTFLSLEDV